MSFANRKEITVKVKGHERRYNVYEDSGRIFYFNTKSSPRRDVELEKNSLTSQEKAWVKSQDNSQPKLKVLAAITKKIEQDIKIKDEEQTQKIAENFKKPTMEAVVKANMLMRKKARSIIEKRNLGKPNDPDNSSIASYTSETSEGSFNERHDANASRRTPSTLRDDEASSVATNSTTGSREESSSDNQSSSIDKSERSSSSSSINSMEAEPPSITDTSRTPSTPAPRSQGLSRSNSSDSWSGRGVNFSDHRKNDELSELSMEEVGPVSTIVDQPPPHSIRPPSSTASTEDSTALYRDLQAIVDILAQLKGNEPQLANVREVLNKAIAKTGGQVSLGPEATVEPPNAGVAGAGTSPAPKVDDIEANIRLLEEVQGKLDRLLETYQDQMEPELLETLVQLQNVVENSITEANKIKKTKNLREKAASARGESRIPLSPMNTDTPTTGLENEEDNDRTDDFSSTPT